MGCKNSKRNTTGQVTETPINFPIPNVTAAAASPNITCRKPENQILFPVNKVIADPIKNKPIALQATLIIMAVKPLVNMKGATVVSGSFSANFWYK
jgi:hypothetical protein